MAQIGRFCWRCVVTLAIVFLAFRGFVYHDVSHIFRHSNQTRRTSTRYIVIHHDSIPRPTDVAEIDAYHRQEWGSGFGYHFYIDHSTITQVRGLDMMGAHTINYNHCSIGICLNGDFDTQEPTAFQLMALKGLVAFLKLKYPDAKVVGHGDLNDTKCPGRNLKRKIDQWYGNQDT